jgi:hypothetical protein
MSDDFPSLLKPKLGFWSFLNSPFTLAIGGLLVATVTFGFSARQQCVKDANELSVRYKKTMNEIVRRAGLNVPAIDSAETVEDLAKSFRTIGEASVDFKGMSITEIINSASDADAQIDWSALEDYYEPLFPFPQPYIEEVEHRFLILGIVLKSLKTADLPKARSPGVRGSLGMTMDAMMRAHANFTHTCDLETSIRHGLGAKTKLIQAEPGIDKKDVFGFFTPPKE